MIPFLGPQLPRYNGILLYMYINHCEHLAFLQKFKMNFINREECELLGDSKYRAYVSQVEKALRNFEYTSEWADLISALGKLNKVSLQILDRQI